MSHKWKQHVPLYVQVATLKKEKETDDVILNNISYVTQNIQKSTESTYNQ